MGGGCYGLNGLGWCSLGSCNDWVVKDVLVMVVLSCLVYVMVVLLWCFKVVLL